MLLPRLVLGTAAEDLEHRRVARFAQRHLDDPAFVRPQAEHLLETDIAQAVSRIGPHGARCRQAHLHVGGAWNNHHAFDAVVGQVGQQLAVDSLLPIMGRRRPSNAHVAT